MIDFIKKNIFIITVFLISLSLGFLTFLTFINKSFVTLNDTNLQILLLANIISLITFCLIIFLQVRKSFKSDFTDTGINSNKKYISFFAIFTIIPSILIAIFSLFLFSFALDKYLDKKVTTAVNNSYELAKNYVEDVRSKIQSEVILVAFDLNKGSKFLKNNPKEFKNFLKTQKLIRNIDELHIINNKGRLIHSSIKDINNYKPPLERALKLVLTDDRPLKIINAFENQSASIIRLTNFDDRYLYVVKFLDKKISRYLKESQQAVNFYYTVENKRTGIKISFAFIYIVIVTLLLFLSISIAIKFTSRFFITINNLISASKKIGEGNLDVKVPEVEYDSELELLNRNFNLMTDKLKKQQQKLIINERHEAWSSIARKLAHEIKNPLTPIKLTIDQLKSKYSKNLSTQEQEFFNNYLKTINKQIDQIENLVNEFSDFARMPKPIFKMNDLVYLINENINFLKQIDESILFQFNHNKKEIYLVCDNEQLSRVFLNLIKNSIESIQEKSLILPSFIKKIDLEIIDKSDYIDFIIIDNGTGFSKKNFKDILKPYFTTKIKGSGLGLSIVNKIINDHNSKIEFIEKKEGAKILIRFQKNAN